jgi:hypothetical protein
MKTNATKMNEGGEEYRLTLNSDFIVVQRVKLEFDGESFALIPTGGCAKVVSAEDVYCQTPNGDFVVVERRKLDNGGEKQTVSNHGKIFYVTKNGGFAKENVDEAQYDFANLWKGRVTFLIDAKVKLDENALVNMGKQVIRSLQNRLGAINKIKNSVNEYNAGADETKRIGFIIVKTGGRCMIPSAKKRKTDSGKCLIVHVNNIGKEGLKNFAQRLGRAFAQHSLMVDRIGPVSPYE